MNYNIRDINRILKFFVVSKEGEFYSEIAEDFIGRIPQEYDFSYKQGLSKCVLVPKNKDYVIKIPFSGRWLREDRWQSFEGRFNGVWDSCESEIMLYDEIPDEFKKFFAEIEFLTDQYEGYPVYIQQKVTEMSKMNVNAASEDIKAHMTSRGVCLIDRGEGVWFESVKKIAGDKFDYFIDVLIDTHIIDDLHNDNIGYINGFPVIIDFAGFGFEEV